MSEVVDTIMDQSYNVLGPNEALQLMSHAVFEYKTHDEAQKLAYLISYSFPRPRRVLSGLSEVFINAIEHGNLDIGFYNKGNLLRSNKFDTEIESRHAKPENQSKKVKVTLERTNNEIAVTIKDEGKGFNWGEFVSINKDNITQPNGRGIPLYIMESFDEVQYIGNGNEVRCKVKIPQ
jgi:hypothetical protein